jgi:hypothetical protein
MAEVNTKALETYVKRRRQEDKNEVNTVALEAYVKARRPGASYLTPTASNMGAAKKRRLLRAGGVV